MRSEVVILGGGVIGASVAFHLARRGVRGVTVIDRAPQPGGGSTSKATGGFRAQFDNETEIRVSLRSREKLLAFEHDTGVDPGYEPRGYLFLACSDEEIRALRAAQSLQHACGLSESRMVTAAEARLLNPAIADERVAGGAFCPTDGFLRPMEILRGYLAAAQRLGVRFLWNAEMLSLDCDSTRVTAVESSAGRLEAARYVNALGAWSGAPVTPLRRNVAATIETALLPPSMPMTIWSGDWYHLRVRDGRVLLLWPDDPVVDDETWLSTLARMTRERVPSVSALPIAQRWSGFYEMTPDGRAIVGRSPQLENLWLATGCSGHGVMHSPAIGELTAELILDGRTSIDIDALRPGRFV